METPSEFQQADADWHSPESYGINDRLEHLQASVRLYAAHLNKAPAGPERQQCISDIAVTINSLGEALMELPDSNWLAVNIPKHDNSEHAKKWRQSPFPYLERKGLGGEILSFLIPKSALSRAKHGLKARPDLMLYVYTYNKNVRNKFSLGMKLKLGNGTINSLSQEEIADILAYSSLE